MNKPKSRKYVSPAREQQALATKNRILDAAESLLLEKGFAAMTVAEVAKKARVSPQTVYAVFSSKAGIILAAIEDRIFRDERNIAAINQVKTSNDPILILRGIAELMRYLYEDSTPTVKALFGTRMVSAELAQVEKELSEHRYEKQAPVAASLFASGKMMPHLSEEDILDIIWTFTSREVYYLLVIRRGWSPEQYEKQLFGMLAGTLLGDHALCEK